MRQQGESPPVFLSTNPCDFTLKSPFRLEWNRSLVCASESQSQNRRQMYLRPRRYCPQMSSLSVPPRYRFRETINSFRFSLLSLLLFTLPDYNLFASDTLTTLTLSTRRQSSLSLDFDNALQPLHRSLRSPLRCTRSCQPRRRT